uniref:Caspase 22, apoptosis-related cysteine peptidase n=1 Tax=Sinocyclocheilus anshuiensis TaxID=1608454 RepID=A0A671N335_9TELE
MGQDTSREVSGTCKHLAATLIGGCQEKKDSLPFFYEPSLESLKCFSFQIQHSLDTTEENGEHIIQNITEKNSLKDLFEFLGFLVEVKEDKTADQIKELMTLYSKDDRHGDCFVCCVMSHGNKTGVEGCDEQICPLNDITSPFDGVNCPALIGKPKVFIIQACRGLQMQSKVVVTHGAGASRMKKSGNVSYSIPKDSDFLIALSTVEGYLSILYVICQKLKHSQLNIVLLQICNFLN